MIAPPQNSAERSRQNAQRYRILCDCIDFLWRLDSFSSMMSGIMAKRCMHRGLRRCLRLRRRLMRSMVGVLTVCLSSVLHRRESALEQVTGDHAKRGVTCIDK